MTTQTVQTKTKVAQNGAAKETWKYKPGNKASASEIKKWKENLQKNIKRGYKKGIEWNIEDAGHLGLSDDHPDVVMAKSVLASLPNGEGAHPSRTEITGMEPMCARWAEGSLAKAMVYGDAGDFENAMGTFISMMEFETPPLHKPKGKGLKRPFLSSETSRASTCSTASSSGVAEAPGREPFQALMSDTMKFGPSREEQKKALSSVIADVWKSADIDGNGSMSQSEARETLRVFLSRPHLRETLGEPLKTVICHRMADDDQFEQLEVVDLTDPLSDCLSHMVHERVLRVCKHAVSKSCMDIAKQLPEMTDSFWSTMDLDQNGEITGDEFLRSFEDAIRKVVLARLWTRAENRAWKMVEAGCWSATTTEKMDGILKMHIENEKRKKKEAVFDLQKLPSAKDEAAEFCQATDCSIM
jgi:hypothetical protein